MWRGDRPGPREGCTGEPPPLRTPWGTSGSSACPLGSPRLFFEEKEDSIFYREQAVFLIFVSFFRCNFYLCSDPNLLVRGEVRGPCSRHPFVEGHGAGSHAHSWLKHRPPGRWGPRAPRCLPGSSHTGTDVRVPVKVDLSWRGPRSAGGTLAGGGGFIPSRASSVPEAPADRRAIPGGAAQTPFPRAAEGSTRVSVSTMGLSPSTGVGLQGTGLPLGAAWLSLSPC